MDLEKRTSPAPDLRKQTDLRASDADRDRTADILREALAEGRLTAEEHSERVEDVFRAKTVGELEPLVADLPVAHRSRPAATFAPAPNRPTPGTVPPVAEENVVAVFSAAVRKGRWRIGRRTHAYAIFGSVEIDLSEAVFEHQQVVIKAIAVFGNVEVRVPENVSLRGNGGGVLGNFEVDTLDSADHDAPVVYVDGLAVLGNIEAKPKRGKLIEDILDRVGDRVNAKLRKHLGH
ncbi:DUF1707 domain-containing protein [Streptomyces phaeochromogenes]|uniref:DUF1707 domain-containing protein n=1 Tax=Streptomyces phaeochromogenes TaxID=1923 RepID=A0ABZ1H9Y4_STRPH|nr:DUF1707 domain-containing protein [Streptomyces phaeochromogenes]MCX5601840.1 DUF1707 domain-containing protein [Streptomyces phaeochromogenes]WRZ29624.1 DUF1707 domain-containing protein [Streptomyces phaeochromogenes]WSD15360.1 DUF1707 domain-containing protein [Streptomyces phaeochromogenes]WSJ07810.1 DUF1707 domain-containing protein [Streptomyces phaeochromogenes]